MKSSNKATKMLARNGWHLGDAVRLLLAVGAVLIVSWEAWVEMAKAALMHDVARPSVLIIPVMVWLIWVRRARFRFIRPGGYGIGWVVLIAGAQFFFMSQYVYELRAAWHLGAVLMLAGAIFVCTGKSVIVQFLPAWAIMPLLVPVPFTLAVLIAKPIQLFEAQSIAMLYGLFGVSVEVFTSASSPGASRLIVSDTSLPLGSVCKGLPTMMSLMIISYGFVFGSPMRPLVRASLLLIAPVIALLCSALSLAGTLWLYNGPWELVTADLIRSMSQWVTLLIAFLLIAGALRLMGWASVPVHQYHLASNAA